MPDYAPFLAQAVAAARAAGELLRADFHRPGGPRGHGDHADADDEAGTLIGDLLRPLGWGILREDPRLHEPGADAHHYWVIDPNDGTKTYLTGWRGSAVSIAGLRAGVPVLGVVYAPLAPDAAGDLIAWAEGCPLTRNGVPVAPHRLKDATLHDPAGLPPVVFVSQDADRNPPANTACVAPLRYVPLPSLAYRLARIAVGDAVAGVTLGLPQDWDYAAGHALLRAVGGVLIDRAGREVTYAPDGKSTAHDVFGGAPAVVDELRTRPWDQVHYALPPRPPPFALVKPTKGQNVSEAGRLARAQGCLLGQLAGDSLGGLVEFRTAEDIREAYPEGVGDLVDGGHWGLLAGQPTDDSELALMLARALVHRRDYDAQAVLAAYQHWYRSRPFDVGSTTRAALGQGTLFHESQANGSLMRISPLGIFGAGRPEWAADRAREDSRLTHPHPVCQDACAVFVAAIAHAVAHGGTPEDCYRAALAEAERSQVQGAIRQALEGAAQGPPADYASQMGWVLIALRNAFWQLLHAESLAAGVMDTVMCGGDTDTNAAIAGALLGAVHGRDAVPYRWTAALLSCRPLEGTPTRYPRPPEFWPVDALRLAEALLWAGTTLPLP
jgi:ADP-ribosylglycohydrolase/fructose-1,6-bisphosphatase/inositol monophosphatase family enzyme